jgi:dipeptidyl aminopeptidase/acylaminoacyl peptidase
MLHLAREWSADVSRDVREAWRVRTEARRARNDDQPCSSTPCSSADWLRPAIPNFSPDGQRVAYVDDAGTGITIANVDGTASNHIATVSPAPEARVSWTPDGRWLLTRRSEEPVLVDIASGTLVPLPSLRKYREITIDR